MKRTFGLLAIVAAAALPFTVGCSSTRSSSDGVQNMRTECSGKECTGKDCGSCANKAECTKSTANALIAPNGSEKAECTKATECPAAARSCTGNAPQN